MNISSDMKIAVLMGGTSAERDISLKSGAAVVEALKNGASNVCSIDPIESNWISQLSSVDFVFVALHGTFGEDGRIQGLLELKNIPYSGTGVLGSALGMDKLRAKQLWQGVGVATPEFYKIDKITDFRKVIDTLGPVFVKPISEGSSLGMSIAETADDLCSAAERASKFGSGVIAERLIKGTEYTVPILGQDVLPVIQIETTNSFYDYDAKYISGKTIYHCPSDLSNKDLDIIRALSIKAFESLGCEVWGRVDLMRDHNGDFFVLEVNTIPGMTVNSLVPKAAAVANITMKELIFRIISLSLVGSQL